MGVQLKSLAVQRSGLFEQRFETALFSQVDAVIAVEDYLTFTYQGRIVEFAPMSRLPAIYGLREFVDAGGLMSYGTDRRARTLGLTIPPALLLRADYIVQ